MLDIKRIRENPKEVEAGIRKKGSKADIAGILKLDEERRKLVKKLDDLRSDQNKTSEKVPQLSGKAKDETIAALQKLKSDIENLEFDLRRIEEGLELELLKLPNPPLPDVPQGKDENDNVVLREEGEKPDFDFAPKDYLDLAETLNIVDVERAGRVSGSRFGYLKGDASLLELALLAFGVRVLTNSEILAAIAKNAGLSVSTSPFVFVVPPVLIRPEMLGRMGYLRKTRAGWENEEVYFMRDDDLVLVGTSEQAIGPMHSAEVFEEKALPRRYLGFSTCFRREAGSYGKDTKGILRVHQFDKLEMFSYTRPEDSVNEHKFMLACEEYLMQQLKIPYRVVALCTGDLAVPSAATYDIEAWMPGQSEGKGLYRETHSTSNTTDFQARRLNIKYRKQEAGSRKQEADFVHMLNGTAFAMGRMIIAIIENYQTNEGKVRVPEVLREYVGKEMIG